MLLIEALQPPSVRNAMLANTQMETARICLHEISELISAFSASRDISCTRPSFRLSCYLRRFEALGDVSRFSTRILLLTVYQYYTPSNIAEHSIEKAVVSSSSPSIALA